MLPASLNFFYCKIFCDFVNNFLFISVTSALTSLGIFICTHSLVLCPVDRIQISSHVACLNIRTAHVAVWELFGIEGGAHLLTMNLSFLSHLGQQTPLLNSVQYINLCFAPWKTRSISSSFFNVILHWCFFCLSILLLLKLIMDNHVMH